MNRYRAIFCTQMIFWLTVTLNQAKKCGLIFLALSLYFGSAAVHLWKRGHSHFYMICLLATRTIYSMIFVAKAWSRWLKGRVGVRFI